MKYLVYIFLFGPLVVATMLTGCESKNEKKTETEKMEASQTVSDTAEVATAPNKDSKEACGNGTYFKYAHSYNNFIVSNQGYILEDNIQFIKAIKREEPNEKVAELYNKLVEETKWAIDTTKTLCAFNGNHEFKNAAVDLFEFYLETWKDYKPLFETKDKKERAKIVDQLKITFNEKHAAKEKRLEEKYMKAHTAFADEYQLYTRSTALHEELDSMLYVKK
ncbi:MAG TPA: hypothetical protein VNB90_14100 [Cytophagaceae bacterium]|nr:hypothetical protein [Cytophagaceae bacterium]